MNIVITEAALHELQHNKVLSHGGDTWWVFRFQVWIVF